MISRSRDARAGFAAALPARRRSRRDGRRRAMALRRRRRQVGVSIRTRAEPRKRLAQTCRRLRRPEAAARARGPSDCHSATMSSVSGEENSGSDRAGSPCSSTTAIRSACAGFADQADRDAAKGGDRHVQRHAHAAHRTAQHHAFAVQIDDAQTFVGGLVGGFETHGQREGVEPQRAARPGSDPADFHLTPRKLSSPGLLPPGCRDNARVRSQSA